jgi:hypothetical protein
VAAKTAKPRKAANRQKSAVFSTRMDANLKRQIQRSAKLHSRGNLSRELDRLLKQALATETQQDKSIRAINYLLGQIALFVSERAADDNSIIWRNNPWRYEAFQAGAFYLLKALAPTGEAIPPAGLMEISNGSAERFGITVGMMVLKLFKTIERPSGSDVPNGYWPYAMPQAREDLGVKSDLETKMMIELLLKGDKQ